MTTRAVEQVDGWDARSFSGGYRGLHDLAADGFSGIVAAGPTRLCMTKGRVVGILDGDIEAFEDASGTVYEAPSPALPLLAVMQDRSDEVRAQYYTEDTPLSEVDRTLADGNFTGYVELSENVLSGDYYQVYHAGQSMSVAFVGAEGELLSDDEAFEKANGEVGIYEVRPVDVEVVEVPEPEDTGGAAAAGATAGGTTEPDDLGEVDATDAADTAADDATDPVEDQPSAAAARDTGDADADTPAAGDEDDTARTTESAAGPSDAGGGPTRGRDDPGGTDRGRTADTAGQSGRSGANRAAQTGDRSAEQRQSNRRSPDDGARSGGTQPARSRGTGDARGGRGTPGRGGDGAGQRAAGSEGVADLETRSIPSLDPDRTSVPDDTTGAAGAAAGGDAAGQRGDQPRQGPDAGQRGDRRQPRADDPQHREGASRSQQKAAQSPDAGADPADIDRLEDELADREDEIERLESELETVEDEREELERELESLREERDTLQERVESLERRVNELRAEEGGESVADRQRLGPADAIDDTNLFVRYESKGEATLEKAHAGAAEAGAVNDNLEIQYHTQFEAEDVAVNGEPFAAFLTDTIQYRFVEWVVRVLPYEIRDTGHEGALRDLYDALPRLDRAELNGTVSVQYREDGETHRSQERFDVVLRDRMGNPLAVANLNESRDPATGDMMESLITAGKRVGESKESLAGAFLVTSSFFEPAAMEAASSATGGGLLSRDSRESYVRLSRKDGFHLCLVEARGENFNLSVPEI